MTMKVIASTCIAAAMIVGPVQQAAADNALVGGIVGGIIGGVIVNEATKNRNAAPRTTTRSTASNSQRAANRETQVALNYFGFPVGTPDGAFGPRSRAAVTEYQVVMGFPATGVLNSFERDLLVGSYYRAQSGGYATSQQIAADPRGVRGLLITYRDEKLGVAPPAGQFAATPAAPQIAPQTAASVPQFAATAPALPSFMGQGVSQASLASHC
ncbi:MAG: peptidoglycan-binding domain-containing protein, partial [Paracoccaceae bacterium]|nr:peptidoglycan-binding domain-containing protein [Paracoccaceae bacterium]